jgi:hypothetical protein
MRRQRRRHGEFVICTEKTPDGAWQRARRCADDIRLAGLQHSWAVTVRAAGGQHGTFHVVAVPKARTALPRTQGAG